MSCCPPGILSLPGPAAGLMCSVAFRFTSACRLPANKSTWPTYPSPGCPRPSSRRKRDFLHRCLRSLPILPSWPTIFPKSSWPVVSQSRSRGVDLLFRNCGDDHATTRTRNSPLWINPLMPVYWCFSLPAVAARVLYLECLKETETHSDVTWAISKFQDSLKKVRPPRQIPI